MTLQLAFPQCDQKILFPYAEALGHGGNFTPMMLSGRNPNCSALVDIWGMNIVKTLPSVAYTLAVISDSANDTAAGTGARTVQINYLDANYLPHVAVYTLNGQTAVTNATSVDGVLTGVPITNVLRINQCEVISAGTGAANAGNIYACDSTNTYTAGVPQTTSKVFDMILIGDNIDSSSSFTVPFGYRLAILGILPALNDITATAKFGKVQLKQTTGANGIFMSYDIGGITSNNNPDFIELPLWPIAEEMSELKGMAVASAATEAGILICGLLWKWR